MIYRCDQIKIKFSSLAVLTFPTSDSEVLPYFFFFFLCLCCVYFLVGFLSGTYCCTEIPCTFFPKNNRANPGRKRSVEAGVENRITRRRDSILRNNEKRGRLSTTIRTNYGTNMLGHKRVKTKNI